MSIEFFVPGDAKSSGSKRGFFNRKTGRVIMAPDNPKQKSWQAKVAWYAEQVKPPVPIDEPVIMTCCFYRQRPSGHFRTRLGRLTSEVKPAYAHHTPDGKPGTKPDSLKCCRAVEDALSGILYRDDALICDHVIRKRYCDNGQIPGVQITIETYEKRKDVQNGKEEKTRPGAGNLFGSCRREGTDNGGNQPAHVSGAQGQDFLHGSVAQR